MKEDVSTKENLFDFDYFYNGAGVSAVDINNDNLIDILLTANQQPNRLFLNKGNLQFEDITEKSGINTGKKWSNGVTTADVNGDGWMDFYVAQGGPNGAETRKNLLLINNGDLTFSEQAQEYGLADMGISTQSAFFDYDRDGDLDCFVMNESLYYGHDPITFHRLLLEHPKESYVSYSHLYENQDGRYVDVTKDAGITQPTFGLGLAITDVNNDGYPDIYIANDYYLPDNLYINRKNGTYRDRIKTHMSQTAFFGMGVDVGDINNDGEQDIYVLDMASKDHYRSKTLMASMDVASFDLLTDKFGFVHQYMFNALHLNNGQKRYHNIAHMSGLAKTDWSWAALIEDVDLDGHKDIFVSNGYRKYALDNDFKNRVTAAKQEYQGQVPLDVKKKLYDEMPSEPLPNVMFHNNGNLQFEDIAKECGLDLPTFSNGAIFADLDNDGDKDLVVNNIDQEVLLYESNASNINNYIRVKIGDVNVDHLVKVECVSGDSKQIVECRNVRGYRSSVADDILIGIADDTQVDEVRVIWRDGASQVYNNVKANETLTISKGTNATRLGSESVMSRIAPTPAVALGVDFVHRENDYNDFSSEVLLPQKQSTLGPALAVGDIDGDGSDDLFVGGARGQAAELYRNDGLKMDALNGSAFAKDMEYEDVGAEFLDIDSDGDQDLYVVSGGNSLLKSSAYYQDRIYLNDGTGNFTRDHTFDNQATYSGGSVVAFDYDRDGDKDIVVGQRIIPQSYPVAAPSVLYRNDGGRLVDVTESDFPELLEADIVNDIKVVDYDGDEDFDVVMVGEWSGIRFYENIDGVFSLDEIRSRLDLTGWWYSITEVNINNDGIPDFVVGNVGKNIKHSASVKKPFKVFATDFDNTGSIDVVLAKDYKGVTVPVRGKECSTEQMPFVSDKFKTYDDFASASLVDIYGSDKLTDSYVREAVEFSTIALVSDAQGAYEVADLPAAAQAFPVLDGFAEDLNNDGIQDVVLIGNIYNTEVETPRLDAGHGLVLLGQRDKTFLPADCPEYCFYASGNAKSMVRISIGKRNYFIVGTNNAALQVFEIK